MNTDGSGRALGDLLREWSLTADGPVVEGASATWLPVLDADRRPATLQVSRPGPGVEHEHLALRAWDGSGAVRLLRAQPRRRALLVERVDPDSDLTTVPVPDACELLAGLYARLHRPAFPAARRLSDLATAAAEDLTRLRGHRLLPRRFADQAAGLARSLAGDPRVDGTLVHGDLHFATVSASQSGSWVAVAPRPVSGEPAYEVGPILWHRWEQVRTAHSVRTALRHRFFTVVDVAGLDEDRARSWAIVRTMARVAAEVDRTESGRAPDLDLITNATAVVKAIHD